MNANLKELSHEEMIRTNGGIWQIISAAMAVIGFINMMAYAVGYTVGTIEKAVDDNS